MRLIAEKFFDPGREDLRFLPEGPRVLRHAPGKLGWVAIQHAADDPTGSINLLDLASRVNQSWALPGRPGFFAETSQPNVLLVGMERRLVYFNLLTGQLTESGFSATEDERVIINDGLAVEGGILFGTKHLEFNLPVAALYYFDGASIRTVVDGQMCSNGKYLRGDTLIDIDSIPKTITRYKLDREWRVIEQSPVIAPDALPGFPDGLRPAPDGESVIVAFYNPAHVSDGVAWQIRLADGEVLNEWVVPGSPRVTCPELVELDGRMKLIFTTAVEGMRAETRAMAAGAGAMYIADTPF